MRSEASLVAEAELRRYEANKLEQLPAGGQCVLQVMKLRKLSVIAPKGSKTLSRLLLGGTPSPRGRRRTG